MKKPFTSLFALLLASAALAADARLIAVHGKVLIKTGGAGAYEAREGDPLYYNDEVKTAPDALAHVAFKDGATILLKGGSDLAIKGRRGDTFLHFNAAEFLIGLKKRLQPGEKFRVRTPAAVAAVRGTLFWGLSDPATKDTTYACFENAIEVTAQGKTVALEPGQKLHIPFGKSPEPPASAADIPADYVQTFAVKGSLQGLDDLMPPPAPLSPTPPQAPEPVAGETPEIQTPPTAPETR